MNEDRSKVDELNESLYSRTKYNGPEETRSGFKEDDSAPAASSWDSTSIDEMLKQERRKNPPASTLKKVFFVALIFFICAVGVAGYIFLEGGNFVSSKNLEISVLGPSSVNAGELLELGITVDNKNNADLQSATLSVQFPEGTRDPADSTIPLTRHREEIGEIKAGRSATYNIQSIMFGEKGDTKEIKITVEYKVKGSSATFTKEKVYDFAIGNTPVSVNLDLPSSVTSGESFTANLTILANSSEILKNVIIKGEYPYGYSATDASPKATQGNNVWAIGDLSPGDKKTIKITGILTGQDEEERTFRFYAGIANSGDTYTFDVPLSYITSTIPIKRPGLGLNIKINNGNSDPAVAPAGKIISSSIEYVNNLTNNLQNVRIVATLSGASLDRNSVIPQGGGFYDSSTNSIVWDSSNDSSLEYLAPGDRGVLTFNFASNPLIPSASKNQALTLNVTVSGTPQGSSGAISISDSKSVKIASEIDLSSRGLYSRGPFKNSGPIPPRAETQTTYTIVLDARNTQNDINNSVVTAQLGSNVKWLNKISPTTENVTYDDVKKTISWNMNTLASGSGFDAVSREVSFQVGLTPSLGQVGVAPVLLTNILFKGTDAFTGETVTTNADSVTTRISTDPNYVQGNEIVTK